MKARGIRNNNPGNIDHNPRNDWKGLADPPLEIGTPPGVRPRFARFTHMKWGVRAIAVLLMSYQTKHGIRTIRGAIARWAPDTENNTPAYIAAVSRKLGVDPDDDVSFNRSDVMEAMVRAIIRHENGKDAALVSERDLYDGLTLAGFAAARPVARSDTAKAAAGTAGSVVAVTAVVQPAVEAVQTAVPALQAISSLPLWIIGAVALGAAAYFIWQRAKQRRSDG